MNTWNPDLSGAGRPLYLAIAELLAADIKVGRLAAGERLPSQRELAVRLDVDFTTVARGYREAQKRGLVQSRVGQGTFVSAFSQPERRARLPSRNRIEIVDLSMNLPPEPDDPVLIERMRAGLEDVGRDIVALMRYQGFGGTPTDKNAASAWLARRALGPTQDRIFISSGAHPALLGIFGTLARPGDVMLSEAITYPGARSIAAQLGLDLVGLPMDDEGIDPDAFASACVRLSPKGIYLNPTLQNPTTLTVSLRRRHEIAAVARRHGVPIIEDDAYGFIPINPPNPIAAIAPEITWHVAGLAKCIGAGIRAAYVIAPDARSGWTFAAAVRAATVMASPLAVALASRWIEDGTAEAILQFIRNEAAARQTLAAEILPAGTFKADAVSFNLWVFLPPTWTRSAFVGHMQSTGVGVVASDAFTVSGAPPEAVRVCLGGPTTRSGMQRALDYMSHALAESPAVASTVL